MRAEYKRDMNHNYLIFHGEDKINTDSYQVRMLVGNVMPSILKCRVQGMDGQVMIYYDITSKQSVSSLYEQKKFGIEDLKLVFGCFVRVMEEMAEYLMNPGQLIIQPEYMYLDAEKKEMYFCCIPGVERDVRQQFQYLTEYILPKLDHGDSQAVIMGYGIYRRALEDSFHLEHIKEELYRVREDMAGEIFKEIPAESEECEKTAKRAVDTAEEELFIGRREDADKKQYRREPEKGNTAGDESGKGRNSGGLRKRILVCAGGALAVFMVLAAGFLGYLPGIELEVILGGIIAGMGTGMLVYVVRESVKKKKISAKTGQKEQMEIYSVKQCPGELCLEEEPQIREIYLKEAAGKQKTIGEPEKTVPEDCGETVILSANPVLGPATLVSREPGELATIYLQEDITVVGKLATAADAVINLPTVSRMHAKIRRRDNEYYLCDLNSRNGTSVNGRLLQEEEEYQLQNEDEVDFAQARYVFLK